MSECTCRHHRRHAFFADMVRLPVCRSVDREMRSRCDDLCKDLPPRAEITAEILTIFSGKELMRLLGFESYPTKPKQELAGILLKKLAHKMPPAGTSWARSELARQVREQGQPDLIPSSPKRKSVEASNTTSIGLSFGNTQTGTREEGTVDDAVGIEVLGYLNTTGQQTVVKKKHKEADS